VDRLLWAGDSHGWPLRESSRFVEANGLRWHVQVLGEGPVVLLVHGTGSSTHSWRDVAPLLARRHQVVMPDLPGHAFTDTPDRAGLSMRGMATGLASLLHELGVTPELVVGHSAGAAVLARMCIDRSITPRRLISLNGALRPMAHLPVHIFAPLARLFATTTSVARFVAWRARDPRAVARLVASTGSTLDARGLDLYGRLVRSPAHVHAVLEMMAYWDLPSLERDLPRLRVPVTLVVAEGDRTVPPEEGERVRGLLPDATLVMLPALGHLAHEEDPQRVVRLIEAAAST